MDTELERLEKLKQEAIENPGKKKKGCKNCKKGKEVIAEPNTIIEEQIYIPTIEEIKKAYADLTSYGGVKEENKESINKVYSFLFGVDFDFGCRGCGNKSVVKFTNYMMKNNIKV